MNIAVYVRVSTQDQSCELQKLDIKQYIQARGWPEATFYEDQASGATSNRPSFRRLINDARARKFDLVICWKLDRLFRSLKDLVSTLSEFQELGIQFVSLKDQIDLTTSSGRLLMHLLAAFAEFEADIIRERVIAGLKAAKARGKRLGRPREANLDVIYNLRKRGLSLSQISKEVGLSKSTVSKTLSNMTFDKVLKNEVTKKFSKKVKSDD